jgi:hypothetical protein
VRRNQLAAAKILDLVVLAALEPDGSPLGGALDVPPLVGLVRPALPVVRGDVVARGVVDEAMLQADALAVLDLLELVVSGPES